MLQLGWGWWCKQRNCILWDYWWVPTTGMIFSLEKKNFPSKMLSTFLCDFYFIDERNKQRRWDFLLGYAGFWKSGIILWTDTNFLLLSLMLFKVSMILVEIILGGWLRIHIFWHPSLWIAENSTTCYFPWA